ncbi:MAG: sugar phosphate nucleotidyltransferase, partial [Methylocystaceae bacterium]
MKAVIMAGGESTRLRPLTCKHPKPMVPVLDRPVMEYIIELLRDHGFTDIMVTLFYLPDEIRNHFGDGSSFGVNLRYFVEEFPLGTAGSVRNAARYLDDTFLVISGDTLTDIDLTRVVEFHRERGAIATLALTQVDNPLEYGVVMTDDNGRITRFLEKPSWAEVFSDLVNTGIYVLEPEIFDYFSERQVFDFSRDLFPLLMQQNKPLYGCLCPEYWCDIGNLAQYRQSHYDILSGRVRAKVIANELKPGIYVGEGAKISELTRLEAPCYIGPGAKIKDNVRIGAHSVVGSNCVINEGASLKRSILWDRVFAGRKAEMRGAVLCHNTVVKPEATVLEGAIIGDGCILGKTSLVRPEVKIWPEKSIDAGATVNSNMIWGTRLSKFLFGSRGVSGLVNLEITPDFMSKLGAAYGSILGNRRFVAVGSDSSRAASMLKRAFISGLMSTGVNVYEIGSIPSPVTRFCVRLLKADGGVHIRLSAQDNTALMVEFYDRLGLNMHRNTERKIDNLFAREDFKRVDGENVGEVVFLTNIAAQYLEGVLSTLDRTGLQSAGLKIAVYCPDNNLNIMAAALLRKLGCEVIIPEIPENEDTLFYRVQTEEMVSYYTRREHAQLGVIIEKNGDRMVLFDETGTPITDDELMALISYILLKFTQGKTLAIPVTVPKVIGEMAREYDGEVLWSRANNPGNILGSIADERVFYDGDELPEFQVLCDAVTALVKIMELMVKQRVSMSQLIKSMPPYYMEKREVHCPDDQKGQVMRTLLDEFKDSRLELVEGVRIIEDEAWTLIVPDDEEPLFTIYTEASSQHKANDITRRYVEFINSMRLVEGELKVGGS